MIWPVLELLRASTDWLAKQGSSSPRLDSEILLAHVLKLRRLDLYVRHDMPVSDTDRAAYRELMKARGRGTPVAHLVGGREFHGHWFVVDARVLVPRPETEHLVDAAVEWIAAPGRPAAPRVLDLCTGSGCVGISIALACPQAVVVAVDISAEAAAVARANAERLGVAARVTVVVGDLLSGVPAGSGFDVVVANPPYIADSEWGDVAHDVRGFEPVAALRSGADALAFHRRILGGIAPMLARPARVALEVGSGAVTAMELAVEALGTTAVSVRSDFAGRPRVVVADVLHDAGGADAWSDVNA